MTDANQPFGAKYTYQPDGNIATAEFHNKLAEMQPRFKYDYTYDVLKRLKTADYSHHTTSWQNGNHFDVDSLTYDPNGNILTLKRRKDNQALIDDLIYTYASNRRLQSVADAVGASAEDWDSKDCEFEYDANGNVISIYENSQPAITNIQYDHRNLPLELCEQKRRHDNLPLQRRRTAHLQKSWQYGGRALYYGRRPELSGV